MRMFMITAEAECMCCKNHTQRAQVLVQARTQKDAEQMVSGALPETGFTPVKGDLLLKWKITKTEVVKKRPMIISTVISYFETRDVHV